MMFERRHLNKTLNKMADKHLANSKRWFPHANRDKESLWTHLALGVAGESGEAVDVVKKISRDGQFTEERLKNLEGETIDALTYLIMLGRVQGIDWRKAFKEMEKKCKKRWG